MNVICGGESHVRASFSFWWRDISKVSFLPSSPSSPSTSPSSTSSLDPLISNCCFKVGNGFNTPVWEVRWLNNYVLMESFPNLFLASSLRKVSVAAMGGWCEGIWKWIDLGISGTVVHESGIFLEYTVLRDLLESFRGLQEGKDCVEWSLDAEKGFTVSSCYSRYAQVCIPFGPYNRCDDALELIWKMKVPFRIKSFGWRLFVNRLPTKDQLVYRGINITSSNLKCVFCDMHLEDRDHIFFKCNMIKFVWKEIAKRVDFPGWNMEECIPFFMEWHSMGRVKRIKEGKFRVFWLATSWIIWLTRNGFCFRNEVWNVNNMIWNIKFFDMEIVIFWRYCSFQL
ncbi:uncharacterized protein LOC131651991 [Vicia villosa]|uniref:uncharacterized protein LOC131651991 n=1 Tax=Vicia villosa TaxID=3911 RepID=UPI00273B2B9A|nr:uncharacterized protein LOC131651991 [Vicia villosa]